MIQFIHRSVIRAVGPAFLASILAILVVGSASAAAPATKTLGVGSSASLGKYLTGPNGHTLYTLSSDPKNASTCAGQCATFWPPLTVAAGGSAHGPAGLMGTFSTFKRSDGTTQVSFNGRALYYFSQDTAPGMTSGEGIVAFGGTWHVAHAQVAAAASASPTSAVAGATAAPGQATPPPTSTASQPAGTSSSTLLAALLLIASQIALVGIMLRFWTRRP